MGYIEELRALIGHRPVILVGALAIIKNEKNEVLLQKRRQPKGYWGLPGGLMELGESAEETARREVWEETGLTIGSCRLLDVLSGPDTYVKVPNGDEFYAVTIVYETNEFSGEIRANPEESLDVRFFPINELPEQMIQSHCRVIEKHIKPSPPL
ncbi:NUDIX hydrolase [Geobacillus sp. E263]|uniref:NUDIX hydrolase n=1 Tax=Geobacillus sp. E263 TaxID=391290 RepID=UPI00117BCE9D|nr:NUDIX hydrolase [Geobacillus sp. E263]